MLVGALRPTGGRIRFKGVDITGLPTHRRAQQGIAFTHQIVRPFRHMTLIDNVVVAAEPTITGSPFQSLVHVDQTRARERALRLLQRLGIADAADRQTAILPLGYLKRMQVARALALDTRLLLLDEPLAGLNYSEAARMADVIAELNGEGRTILLVEHNLGEVTRIAAAVLLFMTAETVTRSPATKKRGPCRRTSSGRVVRAVVEPMPTCVAVVTARAVARHVVSASG